MSTGRWRTSLTAALALAVLSGAAEAAEKKPVRIVFLGDSITDGHIYPALVRQALRTAGKPVPTCINAGIGGDTAAGMRKRLDRDVLGHHPDLVSISAGINDVLHGVKPADYEADLDAIAGRLQTAKIRVILMTPSILGSRQSKADARLEEFCAAVHRVAKRRDCPVAEVNALMRKARDKGEKLLDPDDIHPNFAGHRLMALAVLDALGHASVAVPEKLAVEPWPGLVRDWKLRAVDANAAALTKEAVARLRPDESWKEYPLPEKEAIEGWWNDLERRRGFAMSVGRRLGPGKKYQGIATLERGEAGKAYLNTGAHLQTIWLNGRRVYQSQGWTGWHAGKERVPVELRKGRNTLVIEAGEVFFLSCTEGNDW